MPRFASLLWPAGLGLGVLAEWVGFGWADTRHWVPDLLTGWTLIACGLLGWRRRPDGRVGLLLTIAGFSWFLGNFAGLPAVGWLAVTVTYLHRGPLVHLLLSYPTGRLTSRTARIAVGVGYAAAVVTPAWGSEAGAALLGALLVLACWLTYVRTAGRFRRAKASALQAAVGLGIVVVGGAVGRTLAGADASYPALLAYQIALSAVALGLLAGLYAGSWERAAVTDLVVEMDEKRPGGLDAALAWALQDPTLKVGFWLPATGRWVDARGDLLVLPAAGSGHGVTMVEERGHPSAAVVHRPGLLDDPGLLDAVSTAARLAAANATLHAEVGAQIVELQGSRRRILVAGDAERRRLDDRLRAGAERRLVSLAEKLHETGCLVASDAIRDRITSCEDQLQRTREALRRLAMGLHPRPLAELGLAGALADLAVGTAHAVDIVAATGRLPDHIEVAAYFVCSEAMTNVAKHAGASHVRIAVTSDAGRVTVTVTDDGLGGADPAAGSGLRGLVDRVEALGGSLELSSKPGAGTRLTVHLPLDDRVDTT